MAYWNMQKGSIDMQAGRPGSKFTTKKYWRMSMQRFHSFSTAGSRGGPHTLYEGRLLISIHKNCFGEDGICIHIAILQGMSERLQRTGSFLLLLFFWQGLARCHRLAWNLPRRSHCPWPHHPLDCRAYRAQAFTTNPMRSQQFSPHEHWALSSEVTSSHQFFYEDATLIA